MRLPCPTCHRKGTVPKIFGDATVMMYCDPQGNTWPQEMCQTCHGAGWIGESPSQGTSRD